MAAMPGFNHGQNHVADAWKISQEEESFAANGQTLFRRTTRAHRGERTLPGESARLAIVHGYGDHSGRYLHVMQWMAERGVTSHAVDLRGQGKSTGRRGYVQRWEEYLDDLAAFLKLPAIEGDGPLFLLGHSHGGLVVMAAVIRQAIDTQQLRGIVLSAPFVRNAMRISRAKLLLARLVHKVRPSLRVGSGVQGDWLSSDPEMKQQADPLAVRTATPRWFLTHQRIQEEMLLRAGEFQLPVLILSGDADPIADPRGVQAFYDRCGAADKALQIYPGQLHELLRERQRDKTFSDILGWMRVHR